MEKSSSLYEMWCFLKINRKLAEKYELDNNSFVQEINNTMLFPIICQGTTLSYYNDKVYFSIIFDDYIPKNVRDTDKKAKPFYTVSLKNRPDIRIDIYSKTTENYIGSIILECKYRKLSSYWFNPEKNAAFAASSSSKPQILSYYNDARSRFYYQGVPNTRPVQKVIVLTPDVNGNNKMECGEGVINKALKPSDNDFYLNELINLLCLQIDKCFIDESDYLNLY